MNENPIQKITLEAIKSAAEETANQFADFLSTTLDDNSKKALIQVLEGFKKRVEPK